MTTLYDEIDYPSHAFRQTHPDRLACLAHLFGRPHASVQTCRVLEIGAGDGGNLIPMAFGLPRAYFVGFDLASSAVARGQADIAGLGLSNVVLRQGDILDIDPGPEPFDYVIAHGVYSWVPHPVRDALLALIRRALAPNGLAMVSYNAFPGCRVRQVIRDMMLYALRDLRDPKARIQAAVACLENVVETYRTDEVFSRLLVKHAQNLLSRSPNVLAHDELSEVYHALYLHEFTADAARHHLTFLTDAISEESGEGFRPPDALDDESFDVVDFAQKRDFREARSFRHTVLVRDEVNVDRRPDPGRLFDLHASAQIRPAEEGEGFVVGSSQFQVQDPVLAEAVEAIAAAWPNTVAVRDLIGDADHAAALQRMFWAGLIDLHADPGCYADGAGERPEAHPIARRQAARGQTRLTCVKHGATDVEDAFSLAFIAGLDGTRTREEIARDIAPKLGVGLEDARRQMDNQLTVLAKMPLLVG